MTFLPDKYKNFFPDDLKTYRDKAVYLAEKVLNQDKAALIFVRNILSSGGNRNSELLVNQVKDVFYLCNLPIESAFFNVQLAALGEPNAALVLSYSLRYPNDESNRSYIEALKTLKPELFDGDKINEIAAKAYAGQLQVEAAIAGQADAQWILSQALNNPHDEQSRSRIKALKTLKPELFDGDKINEIAAKTYAGHLQVEAAIAGQADAQWILSQALNKPHAPENQSRIKALKTLKPELFDGDKINEIAAKTYAGQLVTEAAINGQVGASDLLRAKINGYNKNPNNPQNLPIISVLQVVEDQSGVPILTNFRKREQLYNTFFNNVVVHDQVSTKPEDQKRLECLKQFNQNGRMLKRQQNQLPKDELNLIRATFKADGLVL